MDGSSGCRKMSQHRPYIGLVCLVILVIFGRVQSEGTCRTGCKSGGSHILKYEVGSTYKYSYDGKIEISLSSAEGQTTSTELKADVLLTQLADCNQILRLQNVQILGSNGKKFPSFPDLDKPIRINNQDGVLDDSICIVDGDQQNSINVKRAIASLFQTSSKPGYETDVFGRCPTEIISHKDGNVVVIGKSRSLNRCAFRENFRQDFLSSAFNLNSEIKSSPLLHGEYNANLRLKNGILDQTTVTENYLYVPFSVGQNGAKARIVSKLQYQTTTKDTTNAAVTKPRSIIFESSHPVLASTSNVQTILAAVKEVAQTVDVVVGENTAKQFINLLKIVKVSSKSDLLTVYNQVKGGVGVGDKDAARRLYLDALLRAGNGDSIEAVLELLDKNQLDEIDQKLTLLSLNVVNHATEGSIRAVTKLLDSQKVPREAYLGIGNLAGRFCQDHINCESNAEIKALTNKLLSKINAKPANRDQENDTIFALKALANLRQLNDNVIPKIVSLAQTKNLPNRVRIAALETFLADPCTEKLRSGALQILQDIQQDSEVRIKAYLALAQCPNAKIGNAIKTLLNDEPSIQVGGFITSHIHALRASANPDKALAKQFLGFSVRRRFPIDPRKYSFNGDFSYSVDTLGVAASTEANVIYSQNSFLPRSTSLNLTAEVFGHRLNFLELQTRQENLDRLIEHYFGPKGFFRRTVTPDLVKEGETTYKKLSDYITEKLHTTLQRSRRDVSKAEIDHIAKQVQIKTNDLNKDLDIDVSLRAFGSEIFFLNVNEDSQIKFETILDDIISRFGNGLDKLQSFHETFRRNIVFLNAEVNYPTSLGFPLRLAVEGTANLQVKTEGGVDLRQLINNPEKPGEIKIKVIPSANIELNGRLTLDALVVENGLKVISTLYTSTGGDLKASWDRSSGFDIKFGIPVKEQKLISANHEIVFVTREQSIREENVPLKFTQVKDFSICLDQLSPFIGLTFCAEINGPNLGGQQVPILPFPLAGDAKFTITIENDDVQEYHVKHTVKQAHADLVFETIGNQGQKKVAFDLQAEYMPEKYIRALLSSPGKTASAEARIVLTNVEKSLLLKLTNDKDEFSGKIGVTVSGTPERAVYTPILEYRTPNGNQPLPVKLEGQVVVEQNGGSIKYIFENVKFLDSQREISLNGVAGQDVGQVYFTDLKFASGPQRIGVESRFQLTAELIKFNVKIDNTFNSHANFNLKGEFKRQPNHYESAIQLIHGADLNSKTSILTITSSLTNRFKSPSDFTFETKNTISYPLLALNGKFELEHTPKTLDYEINAEYGELKLGSELEAKINEKNIGDYEVEFDIWGLDNKFELKSRRQKIHDDESKISNTLELNGKKFEVEGKVKHNIRPHNLDIGTDLTVHIPTHAAPIKVSLGLKWNQEEVDAHADINSGSEHIVQSFLKGNRKGNANGSVKVNVKNLLTINGQILSNNGAGNGDILIDIKNGNRQIKADTTFTIQPTKVYDVTINIYPVFNKDKNQKIHLSTKNKVSETHLETRNDFDILGHPLQVNAKTSRTGDRAHWKVDGEIEVTLPSDSYLIARGSIEDQERDNLHTGQTEGDFEFRQNKNSPGQKFSFKDSYKNTNLNEGKIDYDISVSVDLSNGRNINGEVALKTSKQNDKYELNYLGKVHGSILPNPYELNIITNCDDAKNIHNYDIHGSYGSSNTFTFKSNNDFSTDKKQGSIVLEAKTASEQLKTLNVDLKGSVTPGEPFKLEGTADIQATNFQGSLVNLKSGGNINVGPTNGVIKGNLAINQVDPISVEVDYKVNNDHRGGSGSVAVSYGKGQTIKGDASLEIPNDHNYVLKTGLQTPFEGYKNNRLTVQTKRSKDYKEVDASLDLDLDGKNWKAQSELGLNELAPIINVKLTNPEGKLTQFFVKGNSISIRNFGGELKLVNEEKSFLLDSSLTVNLENPQNLIVKGQVNSPSLKLNKIIFDLHNKDTSNDHKLQVNVKSGGKNLISGNIAYAAKDENGKQIIEGSGTLKVEDESRTANFKYIQERLEDAKNQESGSQVSFDGSIGDKAIDAEFKLTNKHFRVQSSYCEQKKECAYVEVDNKININDPENVNFVLEVNLDLRKLGLSHEFGLKAVTNRNGWQIDHTVDAHFQNQENSKYQYSVYLHPTQAGASLTTPKRVVALEGKVTPIKNLKQGGKANGEVAFYLDKKNHPNKKTSLLFVFEFNPTGKISGDVKFTHPGLPKALSSSFKASREGNIFNGRLQAVGELDVFAQDNQKLTFSLEKVVQLIENKSKGSHKLTYAITSPGLGINIQGSENAVIDRTTKEAGYDINLLVQIGKSKYSNAFTTKYSPHETSVLIKLFNKVLLKGVTKVQINENDQILQSEISLYDNKPLTSILEIKNYNTATLTLTQQNEKLLLNAGLISGQVADIRADQQTGSNKVNLFYATVKLDEANFLKTEHKVDSKATKALLQNVRERATEHFAGYEKLLRSINDDTRKELRVLEENVKKAVPNLQPLKEYYTKELQKIKEEILNDKSVKELSEAIRKVFGSLIEATSQLFERLSQIAEEVTVTLQNAFSSVIESLDKELIPHVTELGSKILTGTKQIVEQLLDIGLNVVGKALELLEKYQPELQEIAIAFGELFRDFAKLAYRLYDSSSESIRAFFKKIAADIKNSPQFEELKAQYQQFIKEHELTAEGVINYLREVIAMVKDMIPAEIPIREDINNLLDTCETYIEKKLRNQQVDDLASLDEIGKSILNIFKKIISLLNTEPLQLPGTRLDSNNFIPLSIIKNLPNIAAVRFSPIPYLLNEGLATETGKFLVSLVDKPSNLIPPFPLFGLLVQGHVFSFDGKHLTFPGKCNYLLARDAVNGNFTLAGTYKDGVLTSITLVDDQGSVTLLPGEKIKANHEAVELPYRKPTIAAYRDYETISLVSTAGILVNCQPELLGCVVRVSGFYHGQIRGLLGNGNHEPFDDFTIPSGKIVPSEAQFGNAYKLTNSCPDVTVPNHQNIKENPACTKLFNSDSALRVCYPFVPKENFKAACSLGLAANVKNTEVAIAKAYVAACQDRGIPSHVPESLVKCTNSDKPYSVGDTFSVKLPSKSADVVLIVETLKENQQLYDKLVKTLIPEISTEFHNKGVRDIEFHLITYDGQNQYPSHVTVNGKLTFKGKPPALKFGEAPSNQFDPKVIKNERLQELATQLKEILRDLSLATGLNLRTSTFYAAHQYPFRANALKSIVVVNKNACILGKFSLLQESMAHFFKNKQISLNLFTPFEGPVLKDSKKAKDVIGFNAQNVFTSSLAKKNPKGNAELYKDLSYRDYCVDFTINVSCFLNYILSFYYQGNFQNRGNTFVNDNFLALSDADQKQFIKVAATNIVEQLVNVEQGLDCECKLINPFNAINVCHEVYSKDRPSKKV
ncbi:hypothetical protein ABEB36_007695 [Hypothenemus hampei]|uniref:Apolipophorin n=1 Tax=Hypothenemus hampei TaxID=57062 RepID=A0ABD1EV22_HYPHA